MAKINLLTIQWGVSYGALFQAYATCRILENCGHEVTLINLVHPSKLKQYKSLKSLSHFVYDNSFEKFKKKYFPKMTQIMTAIDSSKIPQADYTVVGSDQVWNHDITKDLGLNFFLDFASMGSKRISLASSFGKSEWSEDAQYSERVKEELHKFEVVSVREESGVNICKNVFDINAVQVIDPTLAFGDFSSLVKSNRNYNEIFTFLFRNNSEDLAIVQTISRRLSIPVHKDSRVLYRFRNAPIFWLDHIKNSKFIITSSFHGLAFSIIFKKQFVVLCANEAKFSRIASLLDLLGLSERYIPSLDYLEEHPEILNTKIDYLEVDKIIGQHRQFFMDFVTNNIQ